MRRNQSIAEVKKFSYEKFFTNTNNSVLGNRDVEHCNLCCRKRQTFFKLFY